MAFWRRGGIGGPALLQLLDIWGRDAHVVRRDELLQRVRKSLRLKAFWIIFGLGTQLSGTHKAYGGFTRSNTSELASFLSFCDQGGFELNPKNIFRHVVSCRIMPPKFQYLLLLCARMGEMRPILREPMLSFKHQKARPALSCPSIRYARTPCRPQGQKLGIDRSKMLI